MANGSVASTASRRVDCERNHCLHIWDRDGLRGGHVPRGARGCRLEGAHKPPPPPPPPRPFPTASPSRPPSRPVSPRWIGLPGLLVKRRRHPFRPKTPVPPSPPIAAVAAAVASAVSAANTSAVASAVSAAVPAALPPPRLCDDSSAFTAKALRSPTTPLPHPSRCGTAWPAPPTAPRGARRRCQRRRAVPWTAAARSRKAASR